MKISDHLDSIFYCDIDFFALLRKKWISLFCDFQISNYHIRKSVWDGAPWRVTLLLPASKREAVGKEEEEEGIDKTDYQLQMMHEHRH